MKLKHFFLALSSDDYLIPNPPGYEFPFDVSSIVSDFNFQTEYVSYFIAQRLAKDKIEMEGFDTITIRARKQPSEKLVYKEHLKSLNIEIYFDENRYRELYPFENKYPLNGLLAPVEKEKEFCDFLIAMIMAGLEKARKQNPNIPYDLLVNAVLDFKSGGCKNEWQHKSKSFKDYGIKANLLCRLTANYFSLELCLEKDKHTIYKKEILKTLPSVTHFHDEFKDIKMESDKLFVTRKSELRPRLYELPISELLR